MKVTIEQDKLNEILGNAASFIGAAGPKLEKLAEYEGQKVTFAEKVASLFVNKGIISKEDKADFAQELSGGDLNKVAEAIQFGLQKQSERLPAMGGAAEKQASEDTKPLSADEHWNRSWGLTH